MDESLKKQLEGLFSDIQEAVRPEIGHPTPIVPPSQPQPARSEESYQKLVENIPMGICRATPAQLLIANAAFLDLFGFDSLQAIRQITLVDLFLDPAEYKAFTEQLALQEKVIGAPFQFKRADGRPIECLVTATAVHERDGQIAYLDCVVEDALVRRPAYTPAGQPAQPEPDLWKMRYSVAMSATGLVVYDYDTRNGNIFWSDSLGQVLGYALSEMNGGIAQWAALIHPDDLAALIGSLDATEEKCAPYAVEYRLRHKNGQYIRMRDCGAYIPDAAGKAAHRIGMLQAIAELPRAELSQTEPAQTDEFGEWLRLVFDSMRDAVIVADMERVLVNVNIAAEKMFGYTEDELEQLSLEALHVDREHYVEMDRLVIESFDQGKDVHLRLQARRKNGEIFPTDQTISLIKNDEGQPIAILTVIRDVSAERESG